MSNTIAIGEHDIVDIMSTQYDIIHELWFVRTIENLESRGLRGCILGNGSGVTYEIAIKNAALDHVNKRDERLRR